MAEGEPSKFPNCLHHSPRSASRNLPWPHALVDDESDDNGVVMSQPYRAHKEVPARPCISTCTPPPTTCTCRWAACAIRNADGIIIVAMVHPLMYHCPVVPPTLLPIPIAMHGTGTYSADDVVTPAVCAYPHRGTHHHPLTLLCPILSSRPFQS